MARHVNAQRKAGSGVIVMRTQKNILIKAARLAVTFLIVSGTSFAEPNTSEYILDFPAMHADAEIEAQAQTTQDDTVIEPVTQHPKEIEPIDEDNHNEGSITFGSIFGSVRGLFVDDDEEENEDDTVFENKETNRPSLSFTPLSEEQGKSDKEEIFVHNPKKPDLYPVPRVRPMGRWGQPLSEDAVVLYKKLYEYQRRARWNAADDLFGELTDMRLRGHVLYDRYMDANYKASFEELEAWLALYADHPKASKIYKLAMTRMPQAYPWRVTRPQGKRTLNRTLPSITGSGKRYYSTKARTPTQKTKLKTLSRYIDRDLAKGAPTQALKRLDNSNVRNYMDDVEYDMIRARIAASYLHAGEPDKAFVLAIDVAERSGHYAPMAAWVAGMVMWQKKDYEHAAIFFEQVARSKYASSWTISAGAYWASRANMRVRKLQKVSHWLKVAAGHPRTFYGLLATRALGQDFDFNWQYPEYKSAFDQKLTASLNAQRAELLVQIGRIHEAEQELRLVPFDSDEKEMLLAYAGKIGLPAYALRFGSAYKKSEETLYDAALYPKIPWQPEGGRIIDEALLNALIRQESRFNTAASSSSGAIGLMQLMPGTAHHINRKISYSSQAAKEKLADPMHNIELGQKYVKELLNMEAVNQDLLSMAIAYNAGPGNLRKWKSRIDDTDALFFIENIPMAETRAFVEHVLSNFWIYRLQNGQPTPTLDDVASGRWTRYTSMDAIKAAQK